MAPSSSHSLKEALDAEVIRLELVACKAVMLCAAIGGCAGGYNWLVRGNERSKYIVMLTLFVLVYEAFALMLLRRGIGGRVIQWLSPLVEVSFPVRCLLCRRLGIRCSHWRRHLARSFTAWQRRWPSCGSANTCRPRWGWWVRPNTGCWSRC